MPWYIPAFAVLFLTGCYQDQTRSAFDRLFAADAAAKERVQLEVQADELIIDTNTEPGIAESDPFELKDYPTYSIWPRIREGFQIDTHLDHPRVQTELAWYSKHQEYLYRTMTRAEPFIHYILDEAEKRGLPTELVLLPIVESAYQPFAYSHGRAAGIWQFIPSTGRIYGLEQNWWYDGRRDIYASTQAALQYLQKLNKQFDGDWTLALAAYNSGSGTVSRAIRKNKKKGKPTDFWHLDLPKETRAYVPKLMALKELVESPELYEIGLRCIPDAPGFVPVETETQIDLALAAELAGLDVETLYTYNPAFNRWATSPDGPHRLLLPYDNAEIFKANLAVYPDDQRVQWKRHKIKNGETLSHIAIKYDTTVRELRKVNNIKGNNIRAGQHLLIPVASRDKASYTLSSAQRMKALQSANKKNKTRLNHIVQNGESFWTISRRYQVNMHSLAKWNGMAVRDPLRKGQKLVVWTNNTGSKTPTSNGKPPQTIQPVFYTVRNGDSLSRIANRYRVSINDLHRWNRIKGKYLQPGQKLKLYVDVTEQTRG
ncbi:MAG: LysM peptidoglycan-binding domain-containing protein [Gammaproteobacteria bacterium]|nr:LysM peptidoglycan-binding domain-containing protein [Gammaproteobacteria bacterium]